MLRVIVLLHPELHGYALHVRSCVVCNPPSAGPGPGGGRGVHCEVERPTAGPVVQL